jgi:CRP/FNR family cyclic AMP-dependent transcriptional regulator
MKNVTKFWFLKDFNLFKKMGKKNLMEMCHLLEMINVKKGETLSLNKEDKKVVYFIKRGSIKIVTNEHKHTRSILQMGNIFGELALYEDGGNHENEEKAVVLEDGVVCLIEAEQMKMMMENHSSLKNQLLKLYGLRIRKLQRNLKDLLYKDSETRIKEFVLNYIKEFGLKKEGVLKAKNLLSHQDIAQLTNTSRQTVSNVLSKLRREGVIDYNSKEIFIATMKLKLN